MLNEILKKTAWAILPDSLEQIYTVLRDHKLGATDIEAIEAKLGKSLANERDVRIEDGIAVIPVVGPIARRMNMFHRISGGTSAEVLIQEIENALADEDVDAILLNIDSPGGTVDGTKEIGDLIFESRGKKPIWGFASGTMASGAFWVGSQVDRLSAFDTTSIGSIGVVMSHFDYSKADENAGIKRTYLTAGKYKRIVNDAEPLSDEGRKYIQTMLDDYYNLFLDAVAQGRGVDKETVLKDMADGKMFIASKALRNNMIDAIEPIDITVKLLKEEVKTRKQSDEEVSNGSEQIETEGGNIVKLADLKKEHPELVAQIQEETRTEVTAELQPEIERLTTENEGLRTSHENLESDVRELKKKDTIRTHGERKAKAASIWDTELADSTIPAEMHEKVRESVTHDKYVKDDVFDVEAFTEAVSAEIKDWETRLSVSYQESTVQGKSVTKKTVTADDDDDDDEVWEAEMLRLSGDTKAVENIKAN